MIYMPVEIIEYERIKNTPKQEELRIYVPINIENPEKNEQNKEDNWSTWY